MRRRPIELDVAVISDVELPPDVDDAALISLIGYVLEAERAIGFWEVAIRFTTDPVMQAMHQQFMGLDSPTDIMTFPYEGSEWNLPDTASDEPAGGDILISIDQAAEHGADAGWSTRDEVLFLVCHGVLHLLGWDDGTDDQRAAMLDRQHTLLRGWQAQSTTSEV